MSRITVPETGQLNKQTDRIDSLIKRMQLMEQQLHNTKTAVAGIEKTHVPATSNNLTFTWTGPSAILSWGTGSVRDRSNNNVPVASGSIQLSPSTYYWLAWNRIHKTLVAQIGADGLLQNENNLVICQVYTGTVGETGTAGGGGSSSSGSDLSGSRYKLF